MKKPKKDPIREDRIHNEAIVDAYRPKNARWDGITTWKPNCSFHFRPDASLQISFHRSAKVKPSRSFAWRRKKPAPPTCSCSSAGKAGNWRCLSQLAAIDVDQSTAEAIGDWHYWVAQGYLF